MSEDLKKEQNPHSLPSEQVQEQLEEDDHYLPPRSTVHPTERQQYLPLFYRSLLWLFVMLVLGLLVWGWQVVKA